MVEHKLAEPRLCDETIQPKGNKNNHIALQISNKLHYQSEKGINKCSAFHLYIYIYKRVRYNTVFLLLPISYSSLLVKEGWKYV